MAEGLVHSEGKVYAEDGRPIPNLTFPGDVQVQGLFDPGIVQGPPGGWNGASTWVTARAAASGRLVRVAILGDSIGGGQFATNWLTLGFPGLIKTRLQAAFGDGGSGFVNHMYNQGGSGGGQVTTVGAWTNMDTEGGPGAGRSFKPTVPGNGATITYPVNGTAWDIWFKTDPTFGTFHWQLDGGSFNAVNLNPAASILKVSGAMSAGAHTLTVRATTGDGRVFGVAGRNATGIQVNNHSYSGVFMSQMATDTTGTAPADPYQDTVAYYSLQAAGPVDMVIVVLGINDILLDTAVATFVEDFYNGMAAIRTATELNSFNSEVPAPIIIVAQHVGKSDIVSGFSAFERDWVQAHSMMRAGAHAMGALFIDMWAHGQRSWQYWENRGLWFNPGGPGDDVHPSNLGHAAYADQIMRALLYTP
jgi:Lysophospholipase L1 and related esterases